MFSGEIHAASSFLAFLTYTGLNIGHFLSHFLSDLSATMANTSNTPSLCTLLDPA
jgi:hypothetical protein